MKKLNLLKRLTDSRDRRTKIVYGLMKQLTKDCSVMEDYLAAVAQLGDIQQEIDVLLELVHEELLRNC